VAFVFYNELKWKIPIMMVKIISPQNLVPTYISIFTETPSVFLEIYHAGNMFCGCIRPGSGHFFLERAGGGGGGERVIPGGDHTGRKTESKAGVTMRI